MKKIIAIMMALVMTMAIAVPAFAGEFTEAGGADQSDNTVVVKTDTTAVGAGSYTVSYPAEVVIPWGETKDVTYDVETQLAVGKKLSVSVVDSTSNTVTGIMTADGTADTLEYTISGDTAAEYIEVKDETETLTFTVSDWNKTIAEYKNTITFTAILADV